ncbi:hypothetical protein ABZY14_32525 [Streptomyces sp. NPDC006617]|uniref:hypothetical protein n=1 Tax=Streptomyces sp. NPDC006617 TaxID=3155354 RepID=UPI0033AB801B
MLAVRDGRQYGPVHAVCGDGGAARGQGDDVLALLRPEVHRGAHEPAVVLGRQPVHDLQRAVLDHVREDLAGDLLDDDDALAVGEERCEQFDRGGRGAVFDVLEQAVRLLHDEHVAQGHPARAVVHPQMFDEADEGGPGEEGLVPGRW